jgi:hypothetical protein
MIEDFCVELNTYLQKRYSYKTPPAYYNLNKTISARRVKFDLYLRFRQKNRNAIVIARMEFRETQKGNGTNFLRFISELTIKYSIDEIILECVNTESSKFGEKLGFVYLNNENMMISAKDLKIRLQDIST